MIVLWLMRMNQIRWFYFSIFLTCAPTEPRSIGFGLIHTEGMHSRKTDEFVRERERERERF